MDTSAARNAIFQRIRQAQGRPERVDDAKRQQVQQYLAQHVPGPRPDLGSDLVGRFCQQAERSSQTLDRVISAEHVPTAVAPTGFKSSRSTVNQYCSTPLTA
jgi:L-lactate dehydrogenase complex protein LldG